MVERPKGVNMNNITQLHDEVVKYLNKHNNSWLPLGMKLLELTDAIGDMKKAKYWGKHFKVPSFQHYCSEILKENPDTMSKYRMNAKCIRDYRNDLYEKWEEDNSIQIPGYTIFYELLRKKKVLSDDKFKEILDFIIDDSPLKQGLFSPGMHIPIVSSEVLIKNPPDYLLILAYLVLDKYRLVHY